MPSYNDKDFIDNLMNSTVYFAQDAEHAITCSYKKGKLVGYLLWPNTDIVISYTVKQGIFKKKKEASCILTKEDYRNLSNKYNRMLKNGN